MTLSDLMLAYGCTYDIGCELLMYESSFARAVRHFGPLICHYSREDKSWYLRGEKTMAVHIVAEYRARRSAA